MTDVNVVIAPLQLVYPPFSNYQAILLEDDDATVERLRRSDLYMIGARAQALFDLTAHESVGSDDAPVHRFGISAGGIQGTFDLDFNALLALHDIELAEGNVVIFEGDETFLGFWVGKPTDADGEQLEPFEWFTPEKLIYDRGLGRPGISGLDNYRDFATFELLYVGMAADSDTFERLITGSHAARQKILGAEFPRRVGARVSDEIVFFAFDIVHFRMRTMTESLGFLPSDADTVKAHDRAVTADAEKAFIKLLDPAYNKVKYQQYPRGADGLFAEGLSSYGYFLNQNLTFVTDTGELYGSTNPVWSNDSCAQLPDSGADVIGVRGTDVAVFKGQQHADE